MKINPFIIFTLFFFIFFSVIPAYSRTIQFAGYDWDVKSGYSGPGANYWSDSEESVRVDENGRLRLKIRKIGDHWYCSEVVTRGNAKFGMHRFYVGSRLDNFDPNVVFAMFLYKDDTHEIDMEFSKWGETAPPYNSQYVVQPYDNIGNMHAFQTTLEGAYTTHSINWQGSFITFKSIHGHYDEPPAPNYLIQEWTYNGADNFHEDIEAKVRINLWLKDGLGPIDESEVEVIIHDAELEIDDGSQSPSVPALGPGTLLILSFFLIIIARFLMK